MKKDSKPNSLDYKEALDVLYPYKAQLEKIKIAYLNEEFQPRLVIEYMEPGEALNYLTDSEAFKTYGVKEIGKDLSEKIKKLDHKDYHFNKYFGIEEKHGCEMPYEFDETWELSDVYYYLLYIFDMEDPVIIEHSVINGDLIGILNCFFIRL